MRRVQVQLTDDQLRELKTYANTTGEGVAALVRRAVDAWIGSQRRSSQVERALAAIGGFHSGLGDVAERHDAYLDDAYLDNDPR